jgi:hypothetical protein
MISSSLRGKNWLFTLIVLLLFASASYADSTQLTLTSVGNATVVGNVYVDPYVATVGTGSTAVSTYAICDDWSDNSYVNASWNATIGGITSAGLTGTPLFGNGLSSTQQQTLYSEVAYLATMLLTNNPNPTQQAGISFAIWNLTYPYGTNKDGTAPSTFLNTYGTAAQIAAYNAANAALANAINTNSLGGSYSFEILTPSPLGTNEPQEFLVRAPESSAAVMLGADLFGLLGLVFVFRRRLLRQIQ